jgi:hypothetical protein
MFSLCLSNNGGYFSVGDYNTSYHVKDSSIVNVKMQGDNFYEIIFDKILVGNLSFNVNTTISIIDSGTSLSYFPSWLFNSILHSIMRDCLKNSNCLATQISIKNDICYLPIQGSSKKDFYRSFSDILFVNETSNFTYKWRPRDYIVVMNKKGQKYLCLGFTSSRYR